MTTQASKKKTKPEYEVFKLIDDMPSEKYHSISGTYSSSQLKKIVEDPELFYQYYVTKEVEQGDNPAFAIGTAFHTEILEPHLFGKECAVFEGSRRGNVWKEFEEANKHKAIITKSEYDSKVAPMVTAVRNSPIAMDLIKQGKPEISVFIDIYVYLGEVYSNGHILTENGWEKTKNKKYDKYGFKLTIKCRSDVLGDDFILDLKSTSSGVKNPHIVSKLVFDLMYDLSAAMYLDVFSIALGRQLTKFYWTFASKKLPSVSRTYLATAKSIKVGRAKWRKAVLEIAYYTTYNWDLPDTLVMLDAPDWENKWLKEFEKEEISEENAESAL